MAEVTQLVLAVDSRQVRTATGDLNKFGRVGAQTERQAASLGRTFKGVGTGVGVVVAALASSEVLRAADAYKLLNARLQLVSKNTAEFAKAQSEVLRIAQSTRISLDQTGNLYASLARSTQQLGVSQEDLLDVTESINQALIISGTSAQSAQAALVQLGQGFAAGALRGEELNSVLEQAPRLAQAIADGLGVPLGKLRELGQAGELTAERVFGALQKAGAQLNAEFQRIPLTVGQATTQAANSFSVLIGAIDESTGATEGLAVAISEVSQFVTELAANIRRANQGAEEVGFLARAFTVVSQTVRILWSDVVFVFKGIGREVTTLANQLRELPNAIGSADFSKFRAISDAAKADAIRARQELDKYQQQVLNPFLNSRGRGTTGGADPRLIGTTPPEETVGFRPRGSSEEPGSRRRSRAPREQISEAEKYLQSLRQQLEATADLSVEEALLRDIQLGRLGAVTPAQEQQALALARQIDEFNRLTEAEKAQAEENRRAAEERNRVLEEGRQIYEATRTPIERLAAETDRLNKLLQAGAIDWDTYSRAVFAAQDRFDDLVEKTKDVGSEVDQFAKNALENIQRSLGDELTNILEGDFENIGDSFVRMLNRMVAEAAAADILKALGIGKSGGSQSEGLFSAVGSFFSSVFGGGRATGGPVAAGRMYEVNERGTPELLNVGGRQLLMMGNQSGTVTPMNGGGNSMHVTIHQNFPQNTTRATTLQAASDVRRVLDSAQRNM